MRASSRLPEAEDAQGGGDRLAVFVVVDRQVGALGIAGGDAVDDRGVVVHGADEAGGGEVGEADAGRVAVGVARQAAHEDVTHVGLAGGGVGAQSAFAADDVGVHAGPADVLADLIDDQQVGLVRTAGGPAIPWLLTSSFSSTGSKSAGRAASMQGGLVRSRSRRRPGRTRWVLSGPHDPAHGADDGIVGPVEEDAVIPGGAGLFAQADHHHFHQAAFDGAVVAGVRLDAGDDADMVGAGGDLVEIDGPAFGGAGRAGRRPWKRGSERRRRLR